MVPIGKDAEGLLHFDLSRKPSVEVVVVPQPGWSKALVIVIVDRDDIAFQHPAHRDLARRASARCPRSRSVEVEGRALRRGEGKRKRAMFVERAFPEITGNAVGGQQVECIQRQRGRAVLSSSSWRSPGSGDIRYRARAR